MNGPGISASMVGGGRSGLTDHDHDAEEKGLALRVKALEEPLIEQGLVDAAALDRIVEAYETRIGPRNGASRRALGMRAPLG